MISAANRTGIDAEIHHWKFGVIEFRTRGAGLFFPSEKLLARIMALPFADAKAANEEAWKQKKAADRDADRHSNVSIHGCGTYDRAMHAYYVADQVCKATWRRMQVRL